MDPGTLPRADSEIHRRDDYLTVQSSSPPIENILVNLASERVNMALSAQSKPVEKLQPS